MIDARENIHYNQFLKLSSTYWSAVVNGEGCLTTIPRGKVSIITTINGDKRVVSSISLRNSSERYVANAARHQVRVLARWMPKVSNGVADREITDMTATKKIKGVKRNIITDRNGFILARKVCNAGIHDSKMAHELCGLADDVWEDLRKVLCDRGYRGDVDKDIEKDFGIELEVSNTPNGVKGFLPKPLRWGSSRKPGA